MSTSVAAVQAAYEKKTANQVGAPQGNVSDQAPRYVWYPAEDIPHAEATAGFTALIRERAKALGMADIAVPAGRIERCRLAPILSIPCWEEAFSVPSEMRIEGRGFKDNGEATEYKYLTPAGHVFDGLMTDYAAWGVTELAALRGGELGDALELKIDETFFPERKEWATVGHNGLPIDEIPKAYSAIGQRIKQTIDKLNSDSRRTVLEGVARDMLRAVEVSKAFDIAYIEFEESQKELRYSVRALRALDRLERQRRDYALNAMAEQQKATMDTLPELIKGMAQAQQHQAPSVDPEVISAAVTAAVSAVMAKFGPALIPAPAVVEQKAPALPKKN